MFMRNEKISKERDENKQNKKVASRVRVPNLKTGSNKTRIYTQDEKK